MIIAIIMFIFQLLFISYLSVTLGLYLYYQYDCHSVKQDLDPFMIFGIILWPIALMTIISWIIYNNLFTIFFEKDDEKI